MYQLMLVERLRQSYILTGMLMYTKIYDARLTICVLRKVSQYGSEVEVVAFDGTNKNDFM